MGQLALLVHGDAGETVVGRVADDDQHGGILLDSLGAVPFLLQLREGQRLLHRRLPSGQRVGEEDAGPFAVIIIRQRRAQLLHGEADLQVGDDVGGRA